jgi:hypothetical protein
MGCCWENAALTKTKNAVATEAERRQENRFGL